MIDFDSNWPVAYLPEDWTGECYIINTMGFSAFFKMYTDISKWIIDNIDNPRANAHWTRLGDCMYFKFRKSKDMLFFKLSWPAK